MNQILNIYKPVGVTPFELIQKLRQVRTDYRDVKIGFAGRLDPLAHGAMLLMIGDATKDRNKYLGFSKEYEFEVLFGLATDTYDILGYLKKYNIIQTPKNLEEKIKNFISTKVGKNIQDYPPYSSKPVNGKPLFQWARENKLDEIEIPKRQIEIYKLELISINNIPAPKIKKTIFSNIQSVAGDFRQAEILKKWNKLFENNELENIPVAKFKINCSSGTYVRSIASNIGNYIGSGAITLSIFRTNVGEYNVNDSMRL